VKNLKHSKGDENTEGEITHWECERSENWENVKRKGRRKRKALGTPTGGR